MTGILDRIRNTTVDTLEGVTGDFSDVASSVYRPRVEREMVRTVEGADDLRDPQAGRPSSNAGMVTIDPALQRRDPRSYKDQVDTEPMRSNQRGKIWHLMNELRSINPVDGAKADEWWANQQDVTKVQATEWIDRLKVKIAEGPKQGVVQAPPSKVNAWARWRELAAKLAAVGGSQGTRFAVDTDAGAVNTLAFWRISPSRDGKMFYLNQVIGGQGPVKVRMSPEAMIAIAEKIIAAGPIEAMIRYGLELGQCGHCGRQLTNDISRAAGIGPHCRKHMGGWN